MKIAFACYAFPPEGSNGGLATFYFELSRALAAAGHDVLVIALTENAARSEIIDNVRVERVEFDHKIGAHLSNFGFVPTIAWFLPRAMAMHRVSAPLLDNFAPDVLECAEHGFLWLLTASTRNKPLVVRCLCPAYHALSINYDDKLSSVDTNLITALESHMIRSADALTTPSKSLAAIVAQQTGVSEEQFKIIKNPLAIAPAQTEESPAAEVVDSRLDKPFPKLTFVGRIEKLKGCDLLIEMLPLVLEQFPAAELTLIGSDAMLLNDSQTFGDHLRRRLSELGCQQRVCFKGVVPRDQIPGLLKASDICIFPSRYDSSPYACLEAMSCGVPVIATAVGGIPEYVEDGVTGCLVPTEDPAALAATVCRLSNDTDLRSRLARAAQKSVAETCAPEVVARQSVALYEHAIQLFNQSRSTHIASANSPVINSLFAAWDEFAARDYYSMKVQPELKDAWQNGYTAGYKAGRESVGENPRQLTGLLWRALKRPKNGRNAVVEK